MEREHKISIYSLILTVSNSSWDEHIPLEGPHSLHWKAFATVSVRHLKSLGMLRDTTRQSNQTRILIVWNVSFCIWIFWTGQVSFPGINRELKHDVYGRRQTAKIIYDFLFFSCNPQINDTKIEKCFLLFTANTNVLMLLYRQIKTDSKTFIFAVCRLP